MFHAHLKGESERSELTPCNVYINIVAWIAEEPETIHV